MKSTALRPACDPLDGFGPDWAVAFMEALPERTLAARFCADRNCPPAEFVAVVWRVCGARRGRLLVALAGERAIFAAERRLLESVARATAMEEVRPAIDDYWTVPAGRFGWRRWAGGRISTARLWRLAGEHLPFSRRKRLSSA